jgi:hypothetical protein
MARKFSGSILNVWVVDPGGAEEDDDVGAAWVIDDDDDDDDDDDVSSATTADDGIDDALDEEDNVGGVDFRLGVLCERRGELADGIMDDDVESSGVGLG